MQFLIVENQQKLSDAIRKLESFPNLPEFSELRSVQHRLKYSGGTFTLRQVVETPNMWDFFRPFFPGLLLNPSPWICPSPFLQEISHFLSADSCDSLPLTRLEGVKELSRQLRDNKGQIRELLKESHGRTVLNQLQWLFTHVLIAEDIAQRELAKAEALLHLHGGLSSRTVLQLSSS